MNNLPSWIPSAKSWLSAVALFLLVNALLWSKVIILQFIMPILWPLLLLLVHLLPNLARKLFIIFAFVEQISPILLVAIAHHLLHLFFDRYFPDSSLSERERVRGFFPSLMSWWEGLYGFLTIYLASVLSNAIFIFFSSSDRECNPIIDLTATLSNYSTARWLIWCIAAAYLYQFEHLVRQHLMSLGAANRID